MRRLAIAMILVLAFLVRMLPVLRWETVIGVDAYYHMRLITGYVVNDALYAGVRTAAYPPLFHLVMRASCLPVDLLALYAPPVLSTGTVAATYFILRKDRKLATLAAFLMAVHPALLLRCYFFPELLALLIMPFGYAAAHRSGGREAVVGAFMALTHVFSALYYFAASLAWHTWDRRVCIPVAGLFLTAIFALAQGPSVGYAPSSRAWEPFLYGFGIFLPLSVVGIGRTARERPWFYALAFSLLLCLFASREVATHRIAALSALCVCTTAAFGLRRIACRSPPAMCVLLVCLAFVSLSYVGIRTPVYLAEDTAGAEYLGGVSLSPVASTAGHLSTYYGSTVLIDEYAQYAPGHEERSVAMYSIIFNGSTDYRVLESCGVRLLFAERSVASPTLDDASCVYDGGSRIFVLP